MRSRIASALLLGMAIAAFASQAHARVINTDIYCIQDTTDAAGWGCIKAGQKDTVIVGNLHPVVVTALDTKPSSYGFWIQDLRAVNSATAPNSGLMVFSNLTNFATTIGLKVGDKVVVKGIYSEFVQSGFSLTEIDRLSSSNPESVAVIGSATLPAPILLSTQDLGPTDAATAEKWEGVLIKVGPVVQNDNGVPGGPPTGNFNEFSVYDQSRTPIDTMLVDDKLVAPDPAWAPAGTIYSSITGPFNQENGTYKLIPRGFSDLVTTTYNFPQNVTAAYPIDTDKVKVVFEQQVDPVTATNTANYSMSTFETPTGVVVNPDNQSVTVTLSPAMANGVATSITISGVKTVSGGNMSSPATQSFLGGVTPITQVQAMKSASNDSSQISGKRVCIRGIATGGSSETEFNGTGYLELSAGGPFSGVAVFGAPVAFSKGDDVTVTGFVNEFQRKTELSSVSYVNINSTGNADPPASLIAPSAIAAKDSANTPLNKAALSTAEQWEGVLVTVGPADISLGADTLGFGQWWAYTGVDSCLFDDNNDTFHGYLMTDGLVQNATVTGVCDWSFNVYRVMPRVDSDIVAHTYTGIGMLEDALAHGRVALAAGPNPAHGKGTLQFTLPVGGNVALQVFDTRGRLVQTIADGRFEPGRHTATWNGRTAGGAKVGSGVYLIRLTTPMATVNKRLVWAD